MAASEKEKKGKGKTQKRDRKISTRQVMWIAVIAIIFVLIIMGLVEANSSSIGNISNLAQPDSETDDSRQYYTLVDASNINIQIFDNKIAVLSNSMFTVVDGKNLEAIYEFSHGYSSPVLQISGEYALIFDQGSNKFRLDKSTSNIYNSTIQDEIFCASVSENGYVALATSSDAAKSQILVITKAQKEKLSFTVNDGYVANIAISNNGKYIAYNVVNSENGIFTSKIYIMKVNSGDIKSSFTYSVSSIIDLHFASTNLYVVGNDFITVINSLTDENPVYGLNGSDNVIIDSYCYNNNELVITMSQYSSANEQSIVCIGKNGKIAQEIETGLNIKSVSVDGSYINVLTDENILKYKISNGDLVDSKILTESYSEIICLSSNIYGLYQSNIELINEE